MKLKRLLSCVTAATVAIGSFGMGAALAKTDFSKPAAEEITTAAETLPYLDTSLSFEERAADLVSRMTLEEKVSQIGHNAPAISRLGVSKYYYWREAIHGVARQGKATSFPSSLSMSNTWNRDLVYQAADITSTEARAKNPKTDLSYYSPTVNMARDPRWGRNEESYGEDPYLTGELGSEFVNGMQGDDEKYLKTIATIKHFAANNNEENRRGGTSVMNEFNFRNYYTKVFQNIVEKANPSSVMSSYNGTSIYRNGELIYNFVPSAANDYLLIDQLRRNWGFDGYVTSDCGAGEDLAGKTIEFVKGMFPGRDASKVTPAEAVAKAYSSGLNLECSLGGGNRGQEYGVEAVEKGFLDEGTLDRVVYELFLARMRTGEFDDGSKYSDINSSVLETQEHIDVAEQAAEESWVLLKNDDNVLPLASSVKNIAIVGNYADETYLGDYSGTPDYNVTPYEGIKAELEKTNPGASLTYLGTVGKNEPVMNLKSITLVLKNGSTKTVDLSKAVNVTGGVLANGQFTDMTKQFSAVIRNVDFTDVVSVKAEMASDPATEGGKNGGTVSIGYGSTTPVVAAIKGTATSGSSDYQSFTGAYTGADGGYASIADMYISVSPNVPDFSVSTYKTQLDAADIIIAYAGTTTEDSSESKDRSAITLPSHQSHVKAIADAYPDKTVVAMQTVGQIDVTPFAKNAKAILWTSYNGQTQGTALGKILTGQVNPSGKLTTTWYAPSDLNKMPVSNRTKQTVGGINGYYTDYDLQSTSSAPGRTYQYYTGSPLYPFGYGMSYTNFEYSNIKIDNSAVDANGSITVSADVKNTGTVTGKETAQLYIAFPKNGAGNSAGIADSLIPAKQLKGFEKIELNPNETKTVTFKVNIPDLSLYSEKDQKDHVLNGSYTAIVAKNASDSEAPSTNFTVSGTLASNLKTVQAVPSGIKVEGLIASGDISSAPKKTVSANLSAVMSDEQVFDLADYDATVTYTSKDPQVAVVSKDGTVASGVKEGVTTITASVTIGNVTKTDSFPVICTLRDRATDEYKATAKAEIDTAFATYKQEAYSSENYAKLTSVKDTAKASIDAAEDNQSVDSLKASALADMQEVRMDNLENRYSIASENSAILKDGVIDYDADGKGIPMYTINGSQISGTINSANPYKVTLNALDGTNKVDSSKLKWHIDKLDNSKRAAASINYNTGELTITSNGLVRITASNAEGMACGSAIVHINLQIEGEDADDGGGATLTDIKDYASGSSDAPNNIGNTKNFWIQIKGVKLSNLKTVKLRYSLKTGSADVNFSLTDSAAVGKVFANGKVTETGSWSGWNEVSFDANSAVLDDASVDDYGFGTIYVQTNTANIDYIRFEYDNSAVEDTNPYKFLGVENAENGAINAMLKYSGAAASPNNVLVGAAYKDGMLDKVDYTSVNGAGTYTLNGFETGDSVKLFVWNSLNNAEPLSMTFEQQYEKPKKKELVIYNFSESKYEKAFCTAGEGSKLDEIDGLTGYGAYSYANASGSYSYNGKTYTFTKGLKAGSGNETKSCLYFTPKAPCTVTVLYNGGTGRAQHIVQGGEILASGSTVEGTTTEVSAKIVDTTKPVYIYGAGSNKWLMAIFVEYEYEEDEITTEDSETYEPEPEVLKTVNWGGSTVRLTKDSKGEYGLSTSIFDGIWTDIELTQFASSEINYKYGDKFVINDIEVYGDQLYAACDGGVVLVITPCIKCYMIKKPCNFDIAELEFDGSMLNLYGKGGENASVPLSAVRQDEIAADEAVRLAENGAVLIDVRSAEEFAEKSYEGSVNIPIDEIDKIDEYSKDSTLIFYCSQGGRAERAVNRARELGFINVYNLGSVDKLL